MVFGISQRVVGGCWNGLDIAYTLYFCVLGHVFGHFGTSRYMAVSRNVVVFENGIRAPFKGLGVDTSRFSVDPYKSCMAVSKNIGALNVRGP